MTRPVTSTRVATKGADAASQPSVATTRTSRPPQSVAAGQVRAKLASRFMLIGPAPGRMLSCGFLHGHIHFFGVRENAMIKVWVTIVTLGMIFLPLSQALALPTPGGPV
jgi:hypothetical protein